MNEPTPFDIFSWGVDYGQFLMGEERDSLNKEVLSNAD